MIRGVFLLKYLVTPPRARFGIRYICWWIENGQTDGTEAIIKYVKVDSNNIFIQKILVSFKTISYFFPGPFFCGATRLIQVKLGKPSGWGWTRVQSLKYPHTFIIPTGSSEVL